MERKELRESNTNNKYQSSFLPKLQKAETMIKNLIVFYFFNNKPKRELQLRIDAIVEKVDKELPSSIIDKKSYIDGLKKSANKMIQKYYVKALSVFSVIVGIIAQNVAKNSIRNAPKIETPKQFFQVMSEPKEMRKLQMNIWAEQKGSVRVQKYAESLKSYIGGVSKTTLVASSKGDRDISIWQKAELDIRYQAQMDKLKDLKDKGVQLAYISSHPNCSIRCEKFQGKLVSLTEHAPNPQKQVRKADYSDLKVESYRVRKQDGIWVYSLSDIMATETKGGWNNMIIVGFNCRHELIPYKKGVKPVNEYSAEDIAKQREIESRIRKMEREIRDAKMEEQGYLKAGQVRNAKWMHNKIKRMEFEYKHYCEKNGYAWYQYRINI